MAKGRKTSKPKVPSYQKILRETDTLEAFDALDHCLDLYRRDLKAESCRIALAWRFGLKRNKDGQIVLGNLKKVGPLDQEFSAFDFIIVLNQDTWKQFDNEQRAAVVHHYLCGIAVAEDQNGNTKKDAKNRTMFRKRKPDVVEYGEVINAHGCYLLDLENFVATAMRSKKPPAASLLDTVLEEEDKPATLPTPEALEEREAVEAGAMPAAARTRKTPKRPPVKSRGKARAKAR